MRTDWRLIEHEHRDGAWNMAVDEAIMLAVAAERVPPTLRLYGWSPAAVSLGYFQDADEGVDRAAIARLGLGLVRRPTGGRAILHDDEVTYSVAIREADIPHGHSVMGSYRVISRGIEGGLQKLGVGAQLVDKRPNVPEAKAGELPTVCFAKASRCDMVVDGRKIVGSAQMRRDGAILQHGSVPMTIDLDDHAAVMPGVAGNSEKLAEAACGVADALGCSITFDELAAAIIAGFPEALGVELTAEALTSDELAEAERLYREKFSTDQWNLSRGKRQS